MWKDVQIRARDWVTTLTFLEKRFDAEGIPVLHKLDNENVTMEIDDWIRLPFVPRLGKRMYDDWSESDRGTLVRGFHGTKAECIYSILHHESMFGNSDKALGHRFFEEKG